MVPRPQFPRWIPAFVVALAVAPVAPIACGGSDGGPGGTPSSGASHLVDPTVLQRGEYLVRSVAGCADCHTPRDAAGNLDMSRWMAGAANRFDLVPEDDTLGAISAPNLTPAALGAWSDDAIKHAFLDGVAVDGSPLAPVMPYYALHNMTQADADAIVAYLRSLPAIANKLPARQPLPVTIVAPAPPVPQAAIPHSTLKAGDPNHAAAERGRYLAGEVGFCLDCHTPWRLGPAQPLDLTRTFAGGRPFSAKDWAVPPPAPPVIYSLNVTPHASGIAGWSISDVTNAVRHGVAPGLGNLCRPMPFGPVGGFGGLTDEDARDIGLYLTTIPPIDGGEIPTCSIP
jgi:mono/diheme cytochrome c family protein